ncbi:MAG: hypothetical protein QOF59_1727 [Actinomycetota bacterium]|jgi:hypothetical protein|nr:hypothetical protein [Actinomycetota bacterium]
MKKPTVTVCSVSFLGDHYEYETEMGALPLTIQTTSSIAGERLRVHIPPGACAIIDESSR